ncbi:PAS domain S-box-containing protein [Paenibacillus endophyticus]|uniref:Circadian input-output histidine kinase CikA n=1 Tax=Paenibacillus endophyticus TaxID=1294268 RepID=A0A7W5GBF5_9BACL|nr:PAS domain S-box protein [Paenibacillus endophyticus]MBB3153760.1 PAS domain S-box-containing protein [Paenibacillus endophyticus]
MQHFVNQTDFYSQACALAPIGMAMLTSEGAFLYVNQTGCEIIGYTQSELALLNLTDMIGREEGLALKQDMNESMFNGHSLFAKEVLFIEKNGNAKWMDLKLTFIRDDNKHETPFFIAYMTDITDKKANELEWLAIKEDYDLITGNVLDLISYITPDGITRYISPSVRDLLGYEPKELIGKTNFELYHPDDFEMLKSSPLSDPDVLTYRVRHQDGRYLWFETTYKAVKDESGNVQKLIGIGRDITNRKNHEDSLAAAQNIAMLGSWEWDIAKQLFTMSEHCYKIFNLDTKQPVQKDELISLIHPDDQNKYRTAFNDALEGLPFNHEFRHLQADGKIKFLNIRVAVNFDDNGNPVKMLGTTQDISDRKRIELNLEESVQRYTSLKKYNHDAIISIDLNGNIINGNPVAEQLTGYPVKQLIGLSISTVIGMENYKSLLSDNKDYTIVERSIDKISHSSGHSVEVLATVAPIIVNKGLVGYYLIMKDITEQKNLLIAKETAEKMNKAKSEFLAMMSHEIRTPMNGVIGMTDLLLQTTELDEQQLEYVSIISKSGETLLRLINDILDLSKIESGKTELQVEPFQIRECIAETLDLLTHKALEKNLELIINVNPNVPELVIGDSNRMRQVLINLIGNAIKFTYSGGVTITVQCLSSDFNQVRCQFTVSDTGIGIPLARHHQLFDPFYQLEHFMTRKQEGSGLGLAISKRLVELMHGEIWVESAEEKGATFHFTVVLQVENNHAVLHPDSKNNIVESELHSIKVLIAEDNEVNQLVLTRMLDKLGIVSVKTALNGNEVIQAAAYETFDIIFMDIEMPEMNGVEATRVLKETLESKKCPYIIAVTANALLGDREKYLQTGMDDYISKPLTIDSISEALKKFNTIRT